MTTPRRRLIRPAEPSQPESAPKLRKLRARLEDERRSAARWLSRLRRAFNAMDKHQRTVARLERQIIQLEGA